MRIGLLHAADMASRYTVDCVPIENIGIEDGIVDHVITDPPYADHVHINTRRGHKTDTAISEPMPLGFDPATSAKRAAWARWMATVARKWVGVFSDHESSMDWANHLERAGLQYMRCGLWVRTWEAALTPERPRHSGAPKFQGDCPAAGHEVIVFARKAPGVRWLGGGKAATYTAPVVALADRAHTTQKPLTLMADILRDFVKPGESVVDPFCGSGTTLVAAKLRGCPAFGFDNQANHADYARRRVSAALPPRDPTK